MLFLPLMVILLFSRPILGVLGQEEEVIEHASTYILISLFSIYLFAMYDLTKRFLNCLRTTWVPMVTQVCATLLHIFWCHLFVNVMEWDLYGLGLASTLTLSLIHISEPTRPY